MVVGKLLLLLVLTSFSAACHLSARSAPTEVAKNIHRVKVNQATGEKAPITPGNGLTLVNVFDEFSSGCPTGNRFETIERLNSLRSAGTTLLLIFSDKNFSTQDVENFKAILPMAESMVQGDIEALRPQLIYGKLLVVLDPKGNLVWQEQPDMSEQQVLTEISKLIQSPQ